jgi:hypothetical protein
MFTEQWFYITTDLQFMSTEQCSHNNGSATHVYGTMVLHNNGSAIHVYGIMVLHNNGSAIHVYGTMVIE